MENWKSNLIKQVPYKAGEQLDGDDVIKLNANENPYPPSPTIKSLLEKYDYRELKKYPGLSRSPLDETISNYYNLESENVFSANSSDEILALGYKAFFNSEKPILFPDITYSFYPVWCEFYGIDYRPIGVSDSFTIDINGYNIENGGIIIPNPNAPTGIELSRDQIDRLVSENKDSVVIIDEAYSEFGNSSSIQLINKHDNLLVVKTTSKSRSLAGLRVGYALGSKTLIDALRTACHSFNAYPLSSLSIAVARSSFLDDGYYTDVIKKIKETRKNVTDKLHARKFVLTDSSTNFLFATHHDFMAKDIYEYLYGKKILVRHFDSNKLRDYLRISIGTDEEMDIFINEIDNFIDSRR